MNDGSASEKAFRDKIELYGKRAFLYKITDTKEANRGVKTNRLKVKATPADNLLTWPLGCGYAEIKSTVGEVFSMSMLTDSQYAGWKRQHRAGGKYWVFIHQITNKTWHMVNQDMIALLDEGTRKSIKLKDLGEYQWP